MRACVRACVCVVCVCLVSGDSGVCVCVCVCVLRLLGYYDTMSCLPIVSDRAATEGSKYFELGQQPHEFLTRNTCLVELSAATSLYPKTYMVYIYIVWALT